MRIGIIGAGNIGGTLARHLAKLGHQVSIANSRGPESLAALATEIGAKAATVSDAIQGVDLVILSIPQKNVPALPKGLFDKIPNTVPVIDTGNYYPELRDGRIEAIDKGLLDSQWVAQQIGRPVIKAFNNIFAESLRDKSVQSGTKGRIALSISGDSVDAKKIVLRLIDEIGFDAIDDGPLENSWRQQPGMPAYCQDLELPALKRALDEANKNRIAECRVEQEEFTRKLIASIQKS
jgi:predicted dinucleotide-binding enzyme